MPSTSRSTIYEAPFVLAVDVGSSSVRASLFDARARPVAGAVAREDYRLRVERDGTAEAGARDFLGRVDRCIDSALRGAGTLARQIGAVGLDTLAGNLLGIDRQGRPITPVYTYADSRPKEEAQALRQGLDEGRVYQRTGCPLHTAYAPARFLWLRNTRPEVYRRVHRWVDLGTYLYHNWSGNPDGSMSYAQAAWWGLLDRRRLQWDEELLRYLKVPPEALPRLSSHATAQRGLTDSYARRWPALAQAPFFLPMGDGAAANVGSSCLGTGRAALTIGTSGALRLLLDDPTPQVPPGLWAYRLDERLTLLGGSLNEGGSVLEWAHETLRLPDLDQLAEVLNTTTPDDHGLTVLPFLSGERSPGWSSDASATVLGLTASTTPVQIVQALLEAVSYRFQEVWKLLGPLADSEVQVIASGGAITRSPWWLQVTADVLERPVTVLEEDEATSRGAAILALQALGVWPSLDAVLARTGHTYQPDRRRSLVYREAAGRQRRLYEAMLGSGAAANPLQDQPARYDK